MPIHVTHIDSPFGPLQLRREETALVGLALTSQAHVPETSPDWIETDIGFDEMRRQLDAYFESRRTRFELPLAPPGTAFQQRVWSQLASIGFGETGTYGDIARQIGAPRAARAVGMAVGRNPVPIIIPCHRVMGANGRLTGYSGGLERKQWLLEHEQAADWMPAVS